MLNIAIFEYNQLCQLKNLTLKQKMYVKIPEY